MVTNRVITLVLICMSLAFSKKTLSQWVVNVPLGQEKHGYKMFIYNVNSPLTDVLDETSGANQTVWTGTGKLEWKMDLDSFPGGYAPGDTILCFGSWDSAYAADSLGYGDNPNHTGFYWVFSDTLDNKNVQSWEPDDTLNALPKPIVSLTSAGGDDDTIWVKIPNPRETRRPDQTTYDVLGYWLWADTTGLGTPNALNAATAVEIGFIPVQGGYGDTTLYWQYESSLFTPLQNWLTYFAYRMVIIPDTTMFDNPDSPAYSTHYFSQNSDSIDIYHTVVGIEGDREPVAKSVALQIFPNPFRRNTKIVFSIPETMPVRMMLYDVSGQLAKIVFDEVSMSGRHTIDLTGTNEKGNALASGIYFYLFDTPFYQQTGRLIVLR